MSKEYEEGFSEGYSKGFDNGRSEGFTEGSDINLEYINEVTKKREWVGLTEDEVSQILDDKIGFNSCFGPETDFARAIEAKLKEKNT